MDIEFQAIIKISPESRLGLPKALNYVSKSDIKVELSHHDKNDDEFIVKLKTANESIDEAKERCELELIRLIDIFSWSYGLLITEFGINGYQCFKKDGKRDVVIMAGSINIEVFGTIKKTLNQQDIDNVKKTLEEESDYNLIDILTMWREAIADKSSTSKFFQLYRLLECVHDGIRANAEKWIIKKNPDVPMRMSGKNGKEQVSIYTYLRDNVHYKENKFPYKEIKDNVSAFEGLVKEAILEKYPKLSN